MASGLDAMLANIELCEATRLVQHLGIPACPPLLADMIQEIARSQPDRGWVVQLIEQDRALARALLEAVNSPLAGARRQITTVQGALTYAGLRHCVSFVAGVMLRSALGATPLSREFWTCTEERALAIALIAHEVDAAEPDEAHAFGMFRDCGIALMSARHADYRAWRAQQRSEALSTITERERERYGIDHALLGGLLARNWCLPGEVWLPVSLHHLRESDAIQGARQAGAVRRLVAAGVLADCIVAALQGQPSDPFSESELDYAMRALELVPRELVRLQSQIARVLPARP